VPLEPSHVPVAAYVVEVVPVQLAPGGVVHVTPRHGSTHSPLAPSQILFVLAQFTVVGVYSHSAVPLVPSHVPVAPYVVDIVPAQLAAGGVVQLTPVHGVVHRPVAALHVPLPVAQFTVVAV
jgi:hypothetical protein